LLLKKKIAEQEVFKCYESLLQLRKSRMSNSYGISFSFFFFFLVYFFPFIAAVEGPLAKTITIRIDDIEWGNVLKSLVASLEKHM
jgi:hypothetical protein